MKLLIGTVIFCLLLALCTWLTKPLYQEKIEADLQNKIHNILKDENIDPAGVTLNGHELELPPGTTLTKSAHAKIDKVIGAYIPEPQSTASPADGLRQPTLAIIEDDKGKVTLKGLVANEETRQKIFTAAEAQEEGSNSPREIINNIEVASDVSPLQNLPALCALTSTHLNTAQQAELHYTPTDTKLKGILPNQQAEKSTLATSLPLADHGNTIDNQLEIISPDPIHFGATRKGGEIIATGTFPDAGAQKNYLDLLKKSSGKLEVIDQTKLAANPAQESTKLWWVNSPADFVPNFLANTTGPASFHYSQNEFTAKGLYPNEEAHQKSLAHLGSFPKGITQSNELTLLPSPAEEVVVTQPVHFGATRKGEEIIATGTFPDADSQKQYLALLKKSAGKLKITDKTTVSKQPAQAADALWWKSSPSDFVPHFLASTTGPASFHYRQDKFTAKGLYPNKEAHQKSLAHLGTFPKTITQNNELTLVPPPAEKVVAKVPEKPMPPVVEKAPEPAKPEATDLASNLKLFPVYFKSGSDYISEVEKKKIIQAAEAIKKSKAKKLGLTVGGYADTNGNAKSNKALSLSRAKNVRRKLIALGVPSSQLTVNHFGEDASQTAEEDLWKSRRVEISLTPLKK